MISAAFPYKKQRRRVLGREMAYVEVGKGDPIVLLHGNPTSSYLWRNVLPHLKPLGRCIAPDLIGMGDSDKLPDSGPNSYRFVEHRRYLDALLESLDVRERVTLVIHDWGSALGFDWANRHREAVKGIAYMEAIIGPQYWDHWDKFEMRHALQGLRSEKGEEMVLRDNFFIEKILPGAILRKMSDEDMAEYRRPFAEPGEGRRPLVIALHGGGGNGAQVAKSAGLIDKAAREGFILALPEGSSRFGKLETWNAGGCCAYAMREKIDDIGFIRSMIDELERTQPVDPSRVYVVGMSNGGMMAERVAIELGDRIAGGAVFVGALFGNEPKPVAAVPMLIVNAEKDEQVPVAGGTSTTGIVRRSQGMPYKPSRYAATFWAAANRCTRGPAKTETADYVRELWTGCASGADVDFYIMKGAEHGWPGRGLGRPGVTRNTGKIDGTALMWDFFAAHRR